MRKQSISHIQHPTGSHKLESPGINMPRLMQKWSVMGALASHLAELSVTPERQVGCVVFDAWVTRVWSFGYNGPVTGLPHDTPREQPYIPCPGRCNKGKVCLSVPMGAVDEDRCMMCYESDRPGYIRNPKPSGMQHAEVNTLIRMPVMDVPPLSSVAWLTLAPCENCSRHLVQSGAIGCVVFDQGHDKYDPAFLPSQGIAVVGSVAIRTAAAGQMDRSSLTSLQTVVESLIRKAK